MLLLLLSLHLGLWYCCCYCCWSYCCCFVSTRSLWCVTSKAKIVLDVWWNSSTLYTKGLVKIVSEIGPLESCKTDANWLENILLSFLITNYSPIYPGSRCIELVTISAMNDKLVTISIWMILVEVNTSGQAIKASFDRLWKKLLQKIGCQDSWGCKIHQLHFCREVRPPPPDECPRYVTKQSDGEVFVMLELSRMQSTPSLPSHTDPLRLRVVAPDRVLFMGQRELKCVFILNWIVWNRTVYILRRKFWKLDQ